MKKKILILLIDGVGFFTVMMLVGWVLSTEKTAAKDFPRQVLITLIGTVFYVVMKYYTRKYFQNRQVKKVN
jgi:NhaP-type Na+/H+ or K+/H+ antiporter